MRAVREHHQVGREADLDPWWTSTSRPTRSLHEEGVSAIFLVLRVREGRGNRLIAETH